MIAKHDTLVILTPGFAETELDTTCLPMQQLFLRTLKKTHPLLNIIILSFQYPYCKKNYHWFGIPVIAFNGKNKGGLKKLLLRQQVSSSLKSLHGQYRMISILSFWYGECALVGKRFSEHSHVKHFCWLLGQDAKKENKYPRRARLAGDELIALSDHLQHEFERNHFVRPLHLIPSGITGPAFDVTEKKRSIDLLATGSLIPLKQFNLFVEIVAAVKKQLPAVKALLIGAGPEKEKLQLLAQKLGLEHSLVFAGELSHEEVLEKMRHSKILVHPSMYEGFSGVCQEALFCGARVTSFCRAMNEEIEHWHIVPDKEIMLKKILEILHSNDKDYLSVNPFPMEKTVEKIMKLFTG